MLIVDARRERIGRLGQRLSHFQHGRGLGARQPIPYRRTEGKIGSKVNDKQVELRIVAKERKGLPAQLRVI